MILTDAGVDAAEPEVDMERERLNEWNKFVQAIHRETGGDRGEQGWCNPLPIGTQFGRETQVSSRAEPPGASMTFKATIIKIFLASPADTMRERATARSIMAAWNTEHGEHLGVILMPIGWETDATPEWGEHPQSILNRQLVDECDAAIGVFWTRLGTPTPNATSGTAEEIERCANAGKPVLLYFCRKDASLEQLDPDQLGAMRAFEAKLRDKVLYDNYGDTAEFQSKLSRALTRLVRDRFSTQAGAYESANEAASARGTRLTSPPVRKEEARLTARLENHGRHSYRLVLANAGTVEMREVSVGVPEAATSFRLVTNELPIDVLRPGERVAILASVHMGGGVAIFDVTLSGVTPSGERMSFFSKISI